MAPQLNTRGNPHKSGTIAAALWEEGYRRGAQHVLILQLRHKFGKKATSGIVATVEATSDLRTLEEWLLRILDADTLGKVGIPPKQ